MPSHMFNTKSKKISSNHNFVKNFLFTNTYKREAELETNYEFIYIPVI